MNNNHCSLIIFHSRELLISEELDQDKCDNRISQIDKQIIQEFCDLNPTIHDYTRPKITIPIWIRHDNLGRYKDLQQKLLHEVLKRHKADLIMAEFSNLVDLFNMKCTEQNDVCANGSISI